MPKETQPKIILIYTDKYGNEPYTDWVSGLKNKKAAQRIRLRVRRLENGAYGDCEPVGEGVSELRLFFGPGYRVYFAEPEENVIVLLCAGDKGTQKRDIKNAKSYWQEYQKNE